MSPLVKSHHEFLVEDLDCGRYVEQVSEYRLRGRLPVFVADPLRQEPIQRTGHEGNLQVKIDLHAHHR